MNARLTIARLGCPSKLLMGRYYSLSSCVHTHKVGKVVGCFYLSFWLLVNVSYLLRGNLDSLMTPMFAFWLFGWSNNWQLHSPQIVYERSFRSHVRKEQGFFAICSTYQFWNWSYFNWVVFVPILCLSFPSPLPLLKQGVWSCNTVKARCKLELLSMISCEQSTSTILWMSRHHLHGAT